MTDCSCRCIIRSWSLWLMVGIGLSSCTTGDQLDRFNVFGMASGFEFSCLVGDVTPREAQLWVKTLKPAPVTIQYTTDMLWQVYGETHEVTTTAERDSTAQIQLTGLEPNTTYRYRGVIPGEKPSSECQFKTAPLPQEATPVTFVVGGNTRQRFQPFNVMQSMVSAKPDFFVYLGDTIYADKETPTIDLEGFWSKYEENRQGLLRKLFSHTSVYPMWDDHEVEAKFDANHRLLPMGRRAFFDYWPIRKHDQEPTRLYRQFRWGQGVELFLLDLRQYRDSQTGTMLGEAQKSWLLEGLAESNAMFKFVLSPMPFSDPGPDAWGGYRRERDEILTFIKTQNIPGVIFIAGGAHHAGVSKIPGSTHHQEFIFGPLGAHLNYVISRKEPRFQYFYEASPNYGKITVHADKAIPSATIEWFDQANTLLHQVLVEDNQYYVFTPE